MGLPGVLSKTWAQAIFANGAKTSLGLGSYPVVTLALARDRALANARAIAESRDPRRRFQQVPTFAQASLHLKIHAQSFARHWRVTYVTPLSRIRRRSMWRMTAK